MFHSPQARLIASFDEVALTTQSSSGPVNETVGKEIMPGRYAIVRFVEVCSWASCVFDQTWQFDLTPGEVAYSGKLDAKYHATALAMAVQMGAKETLPGGAALGEHYVAYDAVPPPEFRHGKDLKKVMTFVAARFPAFSGKPTNVVFTPAHFSTGGTISTMDTRTCGVIGE